MALMLFFTTSIMAQVTTSSINGKVVADGEVIIGATVTARHEPSGTMYRAATNENGRYTIQGMRVGGPYTITISYVGYKENVKSNINLALGEPSIINADLKEDAQVLGEVVVTGTAGKGGLGASSNFNQNQIENTPTIDRNIYDVAKMSPLVNTNKFGGITIAGANNRYNSFQIDGMVSNDVFGLAGTGTNGGQTGANPISMDAIEQIQVAVSPFDVRQSGFTGGAINAITKSGTNKFTGSAYTYTQNENLYGRYSQKDNEHAMLGDQTTNTYGASFGGPIIKDKLFFFANFEYKKESFPSTYYPASENYFLTEDMAQKILDRYYAITGYTDSYNQRNIDTDALSLLGRIDWNINENNKFSFRYQFNNSSKDVFGSGTSTYYFNNSSYIMKNKTNSFVAELNSHITESLYNELRFGLTSVRDHREIPYSGPTIYIQNAINGKGTINLGTEYSSGANSLNQDIWTLEDNLSWYLGNHTLTFGTHDEIYNMKNAFIQAANGEFVYSGVDSFLNDTDSPTSYVYKYSDSEITGTSKWATPFKAGQFGFYAQDKWDVSRKLTLTLGIRFDIPVYFNSPSTNDEYNASDFSKKYDSVVGRKPKSYVMVSPRFGFQYYLNDNHDSKLRGGVGIFNGRAPFVWIENAWANTGVEMKGTTIKTGTKPTFTEYGAKDPQEILKDFSGTADKPAINTIDRNFKFPQVFRANLAWEKKLPYGINMTLEAMYSKNLNSVWFENLALVDNGKKVYAVENSENSATTYYSSTPGSYSSIINMTNTNKGYSYSFSAQLEKSFDFGLDLMASYTFGHSYSVNDGTSSVALSNWGYYYCVDPNKADLAYSMFDMPHRVLITANYNSPRYGKGGRWQTHVGLSYNGNSGQRYSLMMSDKSASFNGDYRTGNTLLYIPTEEEMNVMKFASDADKTNFENWIENDKYAKNHRGQYAERNSNSAPWENRFDLHLAQDFYSFDSNGKNPCKFQLICDVYNLANLINKKWGTQYSSTYTETIMSCTKTSDISEENKNQVGTFQYIGYAPTVNDIYSRWHMQLGVRVTF